MTLADTETGTSAGTVTGTSACGVIGTSAGAATGFFADVKSGSSVGQRVCDSSWWSSFYFLEWNGVFFLALFTSSEVDRFSLFYF